MIYISEILNSFHNKYGYEFKTNTLIYFLNRSDTIFRISKIDVNKNFLEFIDIKYGKIYRNSISMLKDKMVHIATDIFFLQHVYLSFTPYLSQKEKEEMLNLLGEHGLL